MCKNHLRISYSLFWVKFFSNQTSFHLSPWSSEFFWELRGCSCFGPEVILWATSSYLTVPLKYLKPVVFKLWRVFESPRELIRTGRPRLVEVGYGWAFVFFTLVPPTWFSYLKCENCFCVLSCHCICVLTFFLAECSPFLLTKSNPVLTPRP